MNNKPHTSDVKVSARRRLLRGTFAVPAVMTLTSGSALATTSLTCVQKLNLPGKSITVGAAPNGTLWIRVPVWQKRHSTDRFTRFVSGGDIASLLPRGTYLPTGSWQCVSITGTTLGYTIGSTYTTSEANAISSIAMTKVANTFVAVRIDATGKVVGVEPNSTAASAMSASCWTSFGGANPFKS